MGEEHPAGWRACRALSPNDESRRAKSWPACVHWKPKQNWRKETCGTCEFYENPKQSSGWCRRRAGAGERDRADNACADWMPGEGGL